MPCEGLRDDQKIITWNFSNQFILKYIHYIVDSPVKKNFVFVKLSETSFNSDIPTLYADFQC